MQQSQQYQITGQSNASVFVLLASEDYTNAPAVTLTNDANNMAIATLRLAVSAMCLRLAPGTETYTLSVSADHPQAPQNYALLLLQGDPNAMICSDEMLNRLASGAGTGGSSTVIRIGSEIGDGSGSGTDGDDSGGSGGSGSGGSGCVATSDALVKVSDSNASSIATIDAGSPAPILGTISGNDWLLVNSGGVAGLAPRASVNLDGDCSSVSTFILDGDQAVDLGRTIDLGMLGFGTGRLLDFDGDGILDTDGLLDLNGDGILGTGELIDVNGDGLLNVNDLLDIDGDGIFDTNGLSVDANSDGSGLNADVDTSNGNLLNANVDTNGDGLADVDVNGDGIVDVDLNGDGVPDVDLNGDGIVDVDLNGDGIIDIDSNGDGLVDADVNTNNGLNVNANVDTNSQGSAGSDVNVNVNPQNNSAPDVNVNTGGDASPEVAVDVNAQASGGGGGLCVNALGVKINC
jgi:hypothetical protein